MSKAKFEAARELIREKKYDEARAVLEKTDHPKAQEWIWKLDDIEEKEKRVDEKPVAIVKEKKGGCANTIGAIFLFAVLVVIALAVFGSSGDSEATTIDTSTPEGLARALVKDVIGRREILSLNYLASFGAEPGVVTVRYKILADVGVASSEMASIICAIRDGGFPAHRIRLFGAVDGINAFGEESVVNGLVVEIEPDTVSRINCANPFSVNLERIAETYTVRAILR